MNMPVRALRQKLVKYNWRPSAVFAAVALTILLPLLGPGYIFTLDMVFPPAIGMPVDVTNTYLFYALLHFLNVLLPSWIIQKLLLFVIFFAAGFGAYRLIRYTHSLTAPSGWGGAYYFAGLLYAVNPFTYTRLMAGQYEVLLGYALLPFLVRTGFVFFHAPDVRTASWPGIWLLAIGIVSIHTFGIALIALGLMAAVFGWRYRRRLIQLKRCVMYGAAIGVGVALLSSYWLLPLLQGQGKVARTISGFSTSDQVAFQTVPGELGLPWNVLALQGFWADAHSLYALPQDEYGWWWIALVMLAGLVVGGIVWSWQRQRLLAAFFSGLLIAGLILSIGTAGTFFAPINAWLTDHIALLRGYREPQKFAMLIVLAYAYFGSVGIGWIAKWLGRYKLRPCAASGFLIPLASAPLLLWGANGQLQSRQYPSDWHTLNTYLQQTTPPGTKTLFLPWHLYMPYRFSERVIASPAPKFFGASILASNNPEVKGAAGYATNPEVAAIGTLLPEAAADPQFASRLKTLSVYYIIVVKDFDYQKYDYLQTKRGIALVTESTNYKLYRVIGEN